MIAFRQNEICADLDNAWHIAYYIPAKYTNNQYEGISGAIISFKNGIPKAIEFWTDKVFENLQSCQVSFQHLIRVLGSSETTPNVNKPMHQLCVALAPKINANFLPNVLVKTRTTRPLKAVSIRYAY